jgi:hypothetical protein
MGERTLLHCCRAAAVVWRSVRTHTPGAFDCKYECMCVCVNSVYLITTNRVLRIHLYLQSDSLCECARMYANVMSCFCLRSFAMHTCMYASGYDEPCNATGVFGQIGLVSHTDFSRLATEAVERCDEIRHDVSAPAPAPTGSVHAYCLP